MNPTREGELERYLAEINRRLTRLPRAQRQEVIDGLREHIDELSAAGVHPSETIARLGTAEAVADAAAMELPAIRRFLDAKRWVQFASVLLSFAGSWSVLFATVHEEYSESLDGVSTITFFRVGDLLGWPTALVLAAAPLVLTIAPTVFDGKIRQTTLVLCTAMLAVTTFVSGLTVGSFLIAALLVAICACILPPRG